MFRNKNTAIIEDIAPWNRHKPFFIVRRRQSLMQFCTYVKLPFIRLRFLHLQNTVHFSNGLVRSCILYWSARSKYFSISSFAFTFCCGFCTFKTLSISAMVSLGVVSSIGLLALNTFPYPPSPLHSFTLNFVGPTCTILFGLINGIFVLVA